MALLYGQDTVVAGWIAYRLGVTFIGPCVAIGIVDPESNALRGGFVLHDWNGANGEMTVLADRAFRRAEIDGIRRYVFGQLGAKRVTFRTQVGNAAATRFLRARAMFECRLKDWYPEGDALQFVLRNDDPRWHRWSRGT